MMTQSHPLAAKRRLPSWPSPDWLDKAEEARKLAITIAGEDVKRLAAERKRWDKIERIVTRTLSFWVLWLMLICGGFFLVDWIKFR